MSILVDKHIARFTEVESSKRPGVLATIKGAVTGWKANRNGRTYSRELWEKAIDSDYVREQVALRHFVGEADHPEERLEPIIKEMSHSITDFEFHDETSEVWATIDILDTPNGHLLKTLLDYSGSLSFSTRGSGDVMDNGEVDPDTYQLFAIDAVLRPSYPTATVTALAESENLGKITDEQAKKLIEKYSGSSLNESNKESDYLESTLFKMNHPKLNKLSENYGDSKDYSNSIEKLYKRWFKENADLGIRFFNLMSDFDIDSEEQGTGPDRCIIYTMTVFAPFVDTQDWKEEIGEYIADHIPSIEFVESTEITDRSSDDYENIIWTFKQQIGIPDFGANIY